MPIKDLRVAENQAAHFEARVIPVGDPRLKVEWLRNGVPISACKSNILQIYVYRSISRFFQNILYHFQLSKSKSCNDHA